MIRTGELGLVIGTGAGDWSWGHVIGAGAGDWNWGW